MSFIVIGRYMSMHLLYIDSNAKPTWQQIDDVKHYIYMYVLTITIVLDSDGDIFLW